MDINMRLPRREKLLFCWQEYGWETGGNRLWRPFCAGGRSCCFNWQKAITATCPLHRDYFVKGLEGCRRNEQA